MTQPQGQPAAISGPREALDDQIGHIERQAGFAAEISGALRDEFAFFWDSTVKRDQVDGAEAFMAQVDSIHGLATRYLADAQKARILPPPQAARLVKMLDIARLLERGRGLETTARALRNNPKVREWQPVAHPQLPGVKGKDTPPAPKPPPPRGTGSLSAPPASRGAGGSGLFGGGKLTDRLSVYLERVTVTTVEAEQVEAPRPPSIAERRLWAFEAALSLVADVLADAGPRLEALRFALSAATNPEGGDPVAMAREAGVPPDLRELIPATVEALRKGPMARRASAIAMQQWEQAARLAEGFTRARTAARAAPHSAVLGILAPYDVNKLKGLIAPLTNLHLTFAQIPALAAIFPPPIKRRMTLAVPEAKPLDAAATEGSADDAASEVTEEGERLMGSESEGEVAAEAASEKLSPEEISRRRMALIIAWMEDPNSNPALSDDTVIYRIVAEEREYQVDRVSDLGMRLRLMPPMTDDEPSHCSQERQRLREALEESRTRQVQLQEVLQYIMERRAEMLPVTGIDAPGNGVEAG